MRRLLLGFLWTLLPTLVLAQGAEAPAYRGVNNWPLIFGTDNTYDIGASGATRPRTGYFGTSVVTPSLTVSGLTSGRVPFASTGGVLSDSADQAIILRSALSATGGADIAVTIRAAADLAVTTDFALKVQDQDGAADLFSIDGLGNLNATGGAATFGGASTRQAILNASGVVVKSTGVLGFSSSTTDAGGGANASIGRWAADVVRCGASNSARCLLGGGANVASATALPVPTGGVFHVTGTTTVTSITSTNLGTGVVITLIFDGILTMTDGSNLKLAGDFVTSADDTLTLAFDGTNWHEIARSVN
jgi:hypothetical protein